MTDEQWNETRTAYEQAAERLKQIESVPTGALSDEDLALKEQLAQWKLKDAAVDYVSGVGVAQEVLEAAQKLGELSREREWRVRRSEQELSTGD